MFDYYIWIILIGLILGLSDAAELSLESVYNLWKNYYDFSCLIINIFILMYYYILHE